MKGKGWHKESRRHSLARKGVSTRACGVRPCPEINYRDWEQVFKEFWKASIERDYSCIDLEWALSEMQVVVRDKLAQNGFLGADELVRWYEERYGHDYIVEGIYDILWNTKYAEGMDYMIERGMPDEEILEKYVPIAVDVMMEIKAKDKEAFDDLLDIYDMLKRPFLDHTERVLLFDRIIHSVHGRGENLWEGEGVDVEKLRREIEKEYVASGKISFSKMFPVGDYQQFNIRDDEVSIGKIRYNVDRGLGMAFIDMIEISSDKGKGRGTALMDEFIERVGIKKITHSGDGYTEEGRDFMESYAKKRGYRFDGEVLHL